MVKRLKSSWGAVCEHAAQYGAKRPMKRTTIIYSEKLRHEGKPRLSMLSDSGALANEMAKARKANVFRRRRNG